MRHCCRCCESTLPVGRLAHRPEAGLYPCVATDLCWGVLRNDHESAKAVASQSVQLRPDWHRGVLAVHAVPWQYPRILIGFGTDGYQCDVSLAKKIFFWYYLVPRRKCRAGLREGIT